MSDGADDQDPRYERKFAPEFTTADELDTHLRVHPSLFRTAFPDRWVNNVYLDTEQLDCFHDNVDGNANRCKYRIRWYGDLLQKDARAVLEIKRKTGLVGTKQRFGLGALDTSGGLDPAALVALLDAAELPDAVREAIARMHPVLANRYRRRYLVSADGQFRATIDRSLSFRPMSPRPGRALEDPSVVLEIKYAREREDGAMHVTDALPFRVSRLSKYVHGVQQLRWAGLVG